MYAHFYHVWVDGDWEGPATGNWKRPGDAHAEALRGSGLRPGVLTVGLTGSPARRAQARAWFRAAGLSEAGPRFVEADAGWEDVTLRALRAWSATADPGTPVLYAHSKGAYNISPVTADHRSIMTEAVVGRWRTAVSALAGGWDAAGCFWDGSIFTGNFWWATAGYLAGLPDVPCANRYEAENWVGLGRPRAYEMAGITYAQVLEAAIGPPEPDAPGKSVTPGASPLGSPAPEPTISLGWATRMC